MRVCFAIPFNSSWILMPTMEAIITPTITINAKIRRNRVLLKWSSISFLNMTKIPCNLSLLKIFHIDLFECIMFFLNSQFFLGQFLNGTPCHPLSFDHDSYPITDPLNLIKEVGRAKNG